MPTLTPGAKMLFLIKRRPATSREELVAHWFANHMPGVIETQTAQAASGRNAARRYIATLFDADRRGEHPWDGMAALWFDKPFRKPDTPYGTEPTDTFQQKAEPYVPWATTEYVILDPSLWLPAEPLTLNAPFPITRSGFYKVSFLIEAKPGTDFDALFAHWLNVHVPNVKGTMEKAGGFGYAVSLSLKPETERYAGLAEVWYADESGWRAYRDALEPDGIEAWVERALVLKSHTEMVGIP